MVLFAKVVHSTLALLPFFCFYRKTFRTILVSVRTPSPRGLSVAPRNRNAIKWYIPISFFFALKKRSEMLVNKRVRGLGKLFENIGVRYQVPKKFGFRGV